MRKKKTGFIEYHGDLSRSSDTEDMLFWSKATSEEKFDAAWELISYYYKSKGRDRELRFYRSIETAGEMGS
jgi:hypothetical protein